MALKVLFFQDPPTCHAVPIRQIGKYVVVLVFKRGLYRELLLLLKTKRSNKECLPWCLFFPSDFAAMASRKGYPVSCASSSCGMNRENKNIDTSCHPTNQAEDAVRYDLLFAADFLNCCW